MRIWIEQATGVGAEKGTRRIPGFAHPFLNVTDRPSPTIMASRPVHIAIEHGEGAVVPSDSPAKPDYRVPTMTEIRELPWNGFNAMSTFSGCGGSSTGYRMAGYKMLWASEFVEAAQETYRANAAPYTILDGRDIREVTGKDIFSATGLGVGELDLFDGSPPCASFSTAGKREKGWGTVKKYSDTEQRADDLFFEYARLVDELQPRTFVAENVSGLVKGTAKGYFKLILARLKSCGYRVDARVLNASWLGVPQGRQRLIFVGVREDLGMDPVHPKPLPYQYTVRDALPWIIEQGDNGGFGAGSMQPSDRPSPTIGASPTTGNGRFPASKVIARVVHDTAGQFSTGDVTNKPIPTILVGPNSLNSRHYQVHQVAASSDDETSIDPETGIDISIRRYAIGEEWENVRPGEISKPTVTAKGGELSAASVTHWAEVRKLTLGELRALSGFPPDFVLTGSYAQRWERVGRAVPPVMMSHIAATVRDEILTPLREQGRI